MTFSKLIIILSHIPVFAVAVYATIIYRQLNSELTRFFWYLITSAILQLVSLILWFNHTNNLFILHILVPLRTLIMFSYYARIVRHFVPPLLFWIFGLLFLGFSIINSVKFQPLSVFNSNAVTIECILMLILAISSFLLTLGKSTNQLFVKNPSLNRINTGVFIYNTSTLIIFYFGEFITSNINVELSRYIWVVHSFFSVIMYYYFWRALWNRETT